MRIQILSDLHLEFEAFSAPKLEVDVVVLAGDIARFRSASAMTSSAPLTLRIWIRSPTALALVFGSMGTSAQARTI